MSNTQLTTTDGKDKEVAVTIPDRVVTEEGAIEAMRRQGAVELSEHYLKDMESVGIYVRTAGVKIQRGKVMINQNRLERAMGVLADIITTSPVKRHSKEKGMDPNKLADLVRALAVASKAMTDSQRMMLEIEGVLTPPSKPTDPDQIMQPFAAGAKVQAGPTNVVAKEVHIHQQSTQPATQKS